MRTQDKGNRFVIVDKETDQIKAQEQIARSSFVELQHDPTLQHIQEVEKWATKWFESGQVTKDWRDFIVNKSAAPGKNSTLYKTHKTGNPVRLLTSGCNTAIENLAKFIERVCAPLTENLRSRIKNTSHLLEIIDDINTRGIPDNTIMVSFDIINMFPSIDNVNGIKAVTSALDKRVEKIPSTECVIEGLKICLFCNNSIFAEKNLLQTNGTATGAPNSCSYADMAITPIDDEIFMKMESCYPELLFYGRYRDDCFALWNGSIEKLNDFFSFMNTLNDDLKFTMEIGGKELCFLDLKISLIENRLCTTVYSKPTDSHLYLHASSCHNASSINGIPKGVALRLRRICSTDDEYVTKSKEYSNHLQLRGYNQKKVNKEFETMRTKSRADARKKVSKDNNTPVIFATKYNPRGPNVKSIINNHISLISTDPVLHDLFPNNSIMVAYKRESNLKDLLLRSDPYNVKSDLVNCQELGYVKCKKKCDSCNNFVDETSFVKSHATGRRYTIRRESSCTTSNIIYVAYCTKCGKQGVGSTVSWKQRLANYKSHIRKKVPSCKIVKHFIDECRANEDVDNLRFIIVDVVNNSEQLDKNELEATLLKKEKFWIGTLVTQHKGLNGTHDWNRKNRTEREK